MKCKSIEYYIVKYNLSDIISQITWLI